MNPIAEELNQIIIKGNPHIYEMLSEVGKNLYFPKGILTQSAEAKERAHRFNATIGMATEKGKTMYLPSVMNMIDGFEPEESLTYAPSYGKPALREAWKKSIYEKNPSLYDKDISLPVVTNAITHGLCVISDLWVDPTDAIIIPDKMWGNYRIIFEVRRSAEFIQYTLFNKDGGFNTEAFEECLRNESKKRDKLIVLLNFPNNPTGYTVTPEEADHITEILATIAREGTNVIAVTDDAYFGLIYEDNVFNESIFSRLINRDPRLLAIKLDGATKENYVWGLRIGFITYGVCVDGNSASVFDALERKTAGDVRGSISNTCNLSQSIILKLLGEDSYQTEKQEKFIIMKKRALEVKRVLTDPKYDKVWISYPFNSGYFMCLRLKNTDAEMLRVHLLEKYGVGLISIGQTDLRIAFSCIEREDIQELFDIIYQGINDLK